MGLPFPDLARLMAILDRSGPIHPERFTPAGPGAAPGTLHPLDEAQRGLFPLDLALLVVRLEGDRAVICPAIIPPDCDREFQPTDRWLPDEHSPFRTLPGTGRMQVRLAWEASVPAASLSEAKRLLPLNDLVEQPPVTMEPHTWVPDWRAAWDGLVLALGGVPVML